MIEIKNISKKFKSITALNNVSLSINEGKIFGVIGKSGAGKSTLIRTINLLEIPDSGEIWVNNIELTKLSQQKLTLERRKIGMIFQHFNLLSSRTIFQNVAFPLELVGTPKKEIKTKVDNLLNLVGIADKTNEYPVNLSGGQKQRVAIARALANDPSILLCDEATSALDPYTTKSILNLLKEINQKLKITIVLITHEMEVINSICDEVAVMENGKLIEHGSVEDIFTNPKENLTRAFIQKSLDISLPIYYKENLLTEKSDRTSIIYKLNFNNIPHYNRIINQTENSLKLNIEVINSKIEYAGKINFGTLFIKVNDPLHQEEKIIAHFTSENFNIEKIGYV